MKYVKFNVNHRIKFKVKPEGFIYWHKHLGQYESLSRRRSPQDLRNEHEDNNGYVTMQAHEFMSIFGGSINGGFNAVFETNVLIEIDETL